MRTMKWTRPKAERSSPRRPWNYALLVDDIDVDGFRCESYGIMVYDADRGEKAAVRHVTVNATEALELLNTVARLAVSPVTLRDVIEDYLGQ